MTLYRKLIRPMHCYPGHNYEPLTEPVEKEEKWYPEEEREFLEKKYASYNEGSFSDLVFEQKFEPYTLELLKNQEVRELTMDEWREWKSNPKRNPICKLWEHDTSPMWVLNPDDVHEPALLMGKLKLFTGKPTFEQCKEVKWE